MIEMLRISKRILFVRTFNDNSSRVDGEEVCVRKVSDKMESCPKNFQNKHLERVFENMVSNLSVLKGILLANFRVIFQKLNRDF